MFVRYVASDTHWLSTNLVRINQCRFGTTIHTELIFHRDTHQEEHGDEEEREEFNILFVDFLWLKEFLLNVKLFDTSEDVWWEEWSNPYWIINQIKLLNSYRRCQFFFCHTEGYPVMILCTFDCHLNEYYIKNLNIHLYNRYWKENRDQIILILSNTLLNFRDIFLEIIING